MTTIALQRFGQKLMGVLCPLFIPYPPAHHGVVIGAYLDKRGVCTIKRKSKCIVQVDTDSPTTLPVKRDQKPPKSGI